MVQKYIIDKADIYNLLTGKEIPLGQGSKARAFCVEVAGGMTNGEVIQTVFPNCKVKIGNDYVDTDIDTITTFTHEWWNASYQKGGEE